MPADPLPFAARLAGLTGPAHREARERLLLEALGDAAPPVREAAIALAARELEPGRLLPLVAEGADALRRNAALAALERQGPYARAAVAEAVYAADADVAMFACQVLGTIGGPSSVPALLHALGRSEVNVVQAAAEALGRLRRPEAVAPLVALLPREPWLQLAATDALGAIGEPAAALPLLALVPDSFVAEPALDALARIAAPEALSGVLGLLLAPRTRELRASLLRVAGAILQHESREPAPSEPVALAAFGRDVEADHRSDSLWQLLVERLGAAADDPPLRGDDRSQGRGPGAVLQATSALVLAAGISSLYPLVVRWGEGDAARQWLTPLVRRHADGLRPFLGSLLAHPDPGVRAGTIALVPPGAVGPPALCRALEDPASAVRIAAARALTELPEVAASLALTQLLDAGAPAERSAAAEALIRLPESVYVPILAPRLAQPSDDATQGAVLAALAEVNAPALEERVLRLAGAADAPHRRALLRAVVRIPGPRAEVILLRALADRDPGLQVEALDLLVARGGDKVRTTLLALLRAGDSLRYHVIRALGRLGHSEAAQPLIALYPDALLHERIEILNALGRLSGDGAMPFLLVALAERQPEVRRVAAQGLAAHAGPQDLPLLTDLARDEDWVVRAEAARALGRLGGAAEPLLLDLGRDLEPTVARTARASLAGR
ncbi:MAG TPA: HEAT repeat domain-containing protein [Solirubrobacterales bacterium]|nr:HEAT repeat domain-containing protein [Solirubrobacterales bacterium]